MNKHIFFQPTFGNRPESIVGREGEIARFMNGLDAPFSISDNIFLTKAF